MPYTADLKNTKFRLMKLSTKYILFISILHLVCLVLAYLVFEKNKVLFILSEVFILVSGVLSWSLYRQLISPLNHLKEGINAIKDRDFNVKFLPTGKREMDELIEVYNQMMDELRVERIKQEEQHFFLEKLIQTSPTGIIILDYDHQVKLVNPKALLMLGTQLEEVVVLANELKAGATKLIRPNGLRAYKLQKSHFIDRGFARFFLMIEEVTSEIFEAEKGVYGKVIRMMAHEVNNTIGPVNSILNLSLQTKRLWEEGDHEALRNALEVAVQRNQNLNLFMRNFADLVKLSPVNKRKIDLVALIYDVVALMKIKATEANVTFEFGLPEEPFFILADAQQMEQAMINIVKNAIEAIERKGIIRFVLKEGRIVISDNGKGISEVHNEQLFSPFFSTKKDGQGIGLTLVREILVNHGFDFFLKTIKQGQTDFVILIK